MPCFISLLPPSSLQTFPSREGGGGGGFEHANSCLKSNIDKWTTCITLSFSRQLIYSEVLSRIVWQRAFSLLFLESSWESLLGRMGSGVREGEGESPLPSPEPRTNSSLRPACSREINENVPKIRRGGRPRG